MLKFLRVCGTLLSLVGLATIPAAAHAGDAVIDGAVKPAEIRDISGGPFFEVCPTGEAIRVINPNGTVLCEAVGGGSLAELDERYINASGDEMLGILAFGPGDVIQGTVDGMSVGSDGTLLLEGLNTIELNASAGGLELSAQSIAMNTAAGVFVDGTLVHSSDRNLKSLLRKVDGSRVLGGLADLPLFVWRWKDRPDAPVHIGPTAQGFAEAFETGDDDRYIASLDAHGVALAAIQELHRRLKDKDRALARLRQQQERLEVRMEELRALVIEGTSSDRAR